MSHFPTHSPASRRHLAGYLPGMTLFVCTRTDFHSDAAVVLIRHPLPNPLLYDTCLLFGGLMTTFHLDAQQNGNRESELAARRLAGATLQAVGQPTGNSR